MASEAVIERMIVEMIGDGRSYKKMLADAHKMTQTYTMQINGLWYNSSYQIANSHKMAEAQMLLSRHATMKSAMAMKVFGEEVARAGRSMSIYLTAPLVLMGRAAIKAGSDFESGFAGIRKTVEATELEFQLLNRQFRQLIGTVPLAATEILRIGEIAGQLGVQTNKITDFTRTIAELSVTTNMSADEGATSLARFANIVQMSQDKFQNLGSAVVELGNKLPATEHEIMEMSMRIAGAGHTVGLAASDILALAASLTSVGIKSEMGGSAISRMMIQVTRDIATGAETIDHFASISGMSTEKFKESWRANVGETILTFLHGLQQLGPEASAVALEKLELDGIRLHQTMLGSANAVQLFADAMNISSTAFEENTALTEEAEKRFATFASQVALLRNRLQLLFTELFEVARPALLELGEQFDKLISSVRGWSKETKAAALVITAIVAATGPFVLILGSLVAALGQLRLAFLFIRPAMLAVFGVPGIGQIIAIVALLVTTIGDWDGAMQNLGHVMGPLKELLMSLGDLFGNLISVITPLIQVVGEGLNVAFDAAIPVINTVIFMLKEAVDIAKDGLEAVKALYEFTTGNELDSGIISSMEKGSGVGAAALAGLPTRSSSATVPAVTPKFDILSPEDEAWHKGFVKSMETVQDMKSRFEEDLLKLQLTERDYLIEQLTRELEKGAIPENLDEVLDAYDKLQAVKKQAEAEEKDKKTYDSINEQIRALALQRKELEMGARAFTAWKLAQEGATPQQVQNYMNIYDQVEALKELEKQKEAYQKRAEEAAKAEEKFRDSIQMTVEARGGGLGAMVAREEARRRRATDPKPISEMNAQEKKKAQEEKMIQMWDRYFQRQEKNAEILKMIEKNTGKALDNTGTVIKPANLGG